MGSESRISLSLAEALSRWEKPNSKKLEKGKLPAYTSGAPRTKASGGRIDSTNLREPEPTDHRPLPPMQYCAETRTECNSDMYSFTASKHVESCDRGRFGHASASAAAIVGTALTDKNIFCLLEPMRFQST